MLRVPLPRLRGPLVGSAARGPARSVERVQRARQRRHRADRRRPRDKRRRDRSEVWRLLGETHADRSPDGVAAGFEPRVQARQ